MSDLVWLDGVVAERRDARIDPFDHGLMLGDGLFETLAAIDGRPVFWGRHLGRLRRSAARLGIPVPFDDPALARGAAELLDGHRTGHVRLRLTVTSGPGPLGLSRPTGPATVVMAVSEHTEPPGCLDVITVPWVRNERSPLAGTKSTSYGEAVTMMRVVRQAGAGEALLGDSRGRLSEAVAANVFAATNGELHTPSLSSGCLPGIAREVLLEAGIGAEADLPMEVLDTADEVFLTSSLVGVMPVRAIDARPLPTLEGPLTAAAAAALDLAARADRAAPWP